MSTFKLMIKARGAVHKQKKVCTRRELLGDLLENPVALNATLWLTLWRHMEPQFSGGWGHYC